MHTASGAKSTNRLAQECDGLKTRPQRAANTNDKPLTVQGDLTVLVDVAAPRYVDARDALARLAELVKSPEHIHTSKISPLSIWNACAAGVAMDSIITALHEYS